MTRDAELLMQQSDLSADLVRDLYRQGSSYVFARRPEDIAREYGFEQVARLASNENPFGPSRRAIEEAERMLSSIKWMLPTALKSSSGWMALWQNTAGWISW